MNEIRRAVETASTQAALDGRSPDLADLATAARGQFTQLLVAGREGIVQEQRHPAQAGHAVEQEERRGGEGFR